MLVDFPVLYRNSILAFGWEMRLKQSCKCQLVYAACEMPSPPPKGANCVYVGGGEEEAVIC